MELRSDEIKAQYAYQRFMHILFKSKKVVRPVGHAYSVSDWGIRTEREREERLKRERRFEPWHIVYGAGGVHFSQRSTTRSTEEQRNMKSNQQRERETERAGI